MIFFLVFFNLCLVLDFWISYCLNYSTLIPVIDENGNCSVEDGYQLSSVVCHVLHPSNVRKC